MSSDENDKDLEKQIFELKLQSMILNKLNVYLAGPWIYFIGNKDMIEKESGKWILHNHYFDDAITILHILSTMGYNCKCATVGIMQDMTVPMIIYCEPDDIKIVNIMVKLDLIQKTKSGKLFNIAYKFNDQTRSGEYGNSFTAKVTLSDYVNLDTGEIIQ